MIGLIESRGTHRSSAMEMAIIVIKLLRGEEEER